MVIGRRRASARLRYISGLMYVCRGNLELSEKMTEVPGKMTGMSGKMREISGEYTDMSGKMTKTSGEMLCLLQNQSKQFLFFFLQKLGNFFKVF